MNENFENVNYGAGMGMTRTINGKRVNLSVLKKKYQNRIDLVVGMSARHVRLLVDQDWAGLYNLALEYDALGAVSTCKQILLEIPTEFAKHQQEA